MTTPTLDEWIEALESGRYEQGRSVLKRRPRTGSAKYCCIGVLCELDDEFTWATDPNSGGWDGELIYGWSNTSSIFSTGIRHSLPPQLQAELHLGPRASDALVKMNDTYSFTFPEVAAVLRLHQETGQPLSGILDDLIAHQDALTGNG